MHIVLVSKKIEHQTIRDYRPINLENEIIKIISKVLSITLGKETDSHVRSSQIAFIRGWMIFKCYAATSEIINYFIKTKTLGILLKIDFEKAFDSVLWEFLFSLMKIRGFGPKFISSVTNIVRNSTPAIILMVR